MWQNLKDLRLTFSANDKYLLMMHGKSITEIIYLGLQVAWTFLKKNIWWQITCTWFAGDSKDVNECDL